MSKEARRWPRRSPRYRSCLSLSLAAVLARLESKRRYDGGLGCAVTVEEGNVLFPTEYFTS